MQTINCSEYTQNNPHQWAHMSLRPLKSRWIVQKAFRWNVLVLFDTQAVIFTFCILSAPFVKPVGHKRNCTHVCQREKNQSRYKDGLYQYVGPQSRTNNTFFLKRAAVNKISPLISVDCWRIIHEEEQKYRGASWVFFGFLAPCLHGCEESSNECRIMLGVNLPRAKPGYPACIIYFYSIIWSSNI